MLASLSILMAIAAYASSATESPEKMAVLEQIFGVSTPTNLEPSTIVPPPIKQEKKSCTTQAGFDGECVPYYLCDDQDNLVTDGTGLLDIRLNDGSCEFLQRCCTATKTRLPENPIKPSTQKPPSEGCGWRNPEGADMRTTGDINGETKFGEFPWMCSIFKTEPTAVKGLTQNVYVGGGSLIHPSVVLTVAHYVALNNRLQVRAGDWDVYSNSEIYSYQDRNVQSVFLHPKYNNANMFFDVALLQLAQPMSLAPHVGVACLPPADQRASDGTRCFATGWGKDTFSKEANYHSILKKVELPVVDRSKCQRHLRNTRLGSYFKLHSSFMCAGGEPGRDTCFGDGGSPLSCPIESQPGRFEQSGIVSWGIGCSEGGVPGVYVDVSAVRDWIDQKVLSLGYDTKVYSV